MTYCDCCHMTFETASELAYDDETGLFNCPNCGSNDILDETEIELNEEESNW